MFEPGAYWGYFNTNYILVGMIIERVTGADLAEVIAQRISHAMNLTDTYLAATGDAGIHGPHPRHDTKFMAADADAPHRRGRHRRRRNRPPCNGPPQPQLTPKGNRDDHLFELTSTYVVVADNTDNRHHPHRRAELLASPGRQ